jgi:hypothetical protein
VRAKPAVLRQRFPVDEGRCHKPESLAAARQLPRILAFLPPEARVKSEKSRQFSEAEVEWESTGNHPVELQVSKAAVGRLLGLLHSSFPTGKCDFRNLNSSGL